MASSDSLTLSLRSLTTFLRSFFHRSCKLLLTLLPLFLRQESGKPISYCLALRCFRQFPLVRRFAIHCSYLPSLQISQPESASLSPSPVAAIRVWSCCPHYRNQTRKPRRLLRHAIL